MRTGQINFALLKNNEFLEIELNNDTKNQMNFLIVNHESVNIIIVY